MDFVVALLIWFAITAVWLAIPAFLCRLLIRMALFNLWRHRSIRWSVDSAFAGFVFLVFFMICGFITREPEPKEIDEQVEQTKFGIGQWDKFATTYGRFRDITFIKVFWSRYQYSLSCRLSAVLLPGTQSSDTQADRKDPSTDFFVLDTALGARTDINIA